MVCVGGGKRKEGGKKEGGRKREERENIRTLTSFAFSLAWLVTFTELEKVLKCCLSFRHCRDCFSVLQNHTLRQHFLPMCLLMVAVSIGIETRLKQCYLVVLMNTTGTVLSILCICICALWHHFFSVFYD